MCADPYNTIKGEVDSATPGVANSGENNNCVNSSDFMIVGDPVVTLTATPSRVDENQTSALTWTTSNIVAGSCSGAGVGFTGAVADNRSSPGVDVHPTIAGNPNHYGVLCTGTNGNSAAGYADVIVNDPQLSITASPLRVAKGGTSSIKWWAIDVSGCSISGPGLTPTNPRTDFSTDPNVPTTQAVTNITTQSIYKIDCTSSSGTYTKSATVNVVPIYQDF